MRCFNHVIALVAKRLIRQFDVPKGGTEAALDDAEQALRELAEGIDIEEDQTQAELETDDGDDDDNDVGNDEELNMSQHARKKLDERTRPMKRVLVKV